MMTKFLKRIFSGPSLTIRQRVTGAFLVMALLVVASAISGFWATISVAGHIRTVQQGIEQLQSVDRIKFSWQSIMMSIDNMLLTRQFGVNEKLIQEQLTTLNLEIDRLQNRALDQSVDPANAAVIAELKDRGILANEVVNRILQEVGQGDRISAETLRYSDLADVQRDFDTTLAKFDTSTNTRMQAALTATVQAENFNRIFWLVTTASAVLLGGFLAFSTSRRLTRPINQLIVNVKQVTEGNFQPIPALREKDEIGELSRAFSLLTNWLRESHEQLEQRVDERTRDLERRTTQVRVAAQVAREINSSQNLNEVLTRAVDLIRERFDYYYAGIFLTDDREKYAVLRAGTGEAGSQMQERGHRLQIGQTSLVGAAAFNGQPLIAQDVSQDETHFKNPLLPATQAELALPLKLGKRVIGVLDVQSSSVGAFTEEDITTLQIVADQLATAIENSRLVQELKENFHQLQSFYAHSDVETWHKIENSQKVKGYTYEPSGVKPILSTSKDGLGDGAPVIIPLKVRGSQIGTLEVWPLTGRMQSSEVAAMETISERLSQALESARLFQETQNRALREQMAGEVTARIRQTLDIETMLQTAVSEIQKGLGLPEVVIRLGKPPAQSLGTGAAPRSSSGNGTNGHHPSQE